MLKPIVSLAAVGFVGAIVARMLWLLLFPIFGVFFGIVLLIIKIALIGGLIWGCFYVVRRFMDKPAEA